MCFYCDKIGQSKRHCPKFKEQQRKNNNQDDEGKEDPNVIDCHLVVMSSCMNICGGSTHGSTSDKRLFATCKFEVLWSNEDR